MHDGRNEHGECRVASMSRMRGLKATVVALLVCVTAIAIAAPDMGALGGRYFRVTITPNAKPLLAEAMFDDTDGRFIVKGASLANLIARAYDVQAYQVVGAPEWVYRAHLYDIEAEPPPAEFVASDPTQMLQALLSDRFGLQMRRETREVTMLVLDKDAARQRELARDIDCTEDRRRAAQPVLRASAPDAYTRLQLMLFARCLAPQYLVSGLARQIGEPIHATTGTGLLFIANGLRVLPEPGEDSLAIAADALAPSGLLLTRRSVELDVLVVTAIEHPELDAIDR